MLFAVDTSTLIVLRELDWIDLCIQAGHQFIWPSSVTEELEGQRSKNQKLLRLLATQEAIEQAPQQPLRIEEISQADADVIAVAREQQATILSEDILLRKKAERTGVSAIALASFCVLLYQSGFFSRDECFARLKTMFEKRFISQTTYRQLLLGLRL